jgi:DNA-binding NarL/FixJ family response regulator
MFGFMKPNRIDNATRWQLHLTALQQFVTRTGSARVPSTHTEVVEGRNVALGAWVGYMRQRNRAGLLSSERKQTLEGISGWAWGPLRPGPATNTERDENILVLRSQGLSLETIASKFGISRQRVHQIARSHTNANA